MTMNRKIPKTDEEWKKRLTPEQYYILRRKGTEPQFQGRYIEMKERGIFACVACGNELFRSETKYDSGTGWPSFYDAIPGSIEIKTDETHGMTKIEVMCKRCGGHLGHVFDDGPKETGKRYCINSISLDFRKNKVKYGKK